MDYRRTLGILTWLTGITAACGAVDDGDPAAEAEATEETLAWLASQQSAPTSTDQTQVSRATAERASPMHAPTSHEPTLHRSNTPTMAARGHAQSDPTTVIRTQDAPSPQGGIRSDGSGATTAPVAVAPDFSQRAISNPSSEPPVRVLNDPNDWTIGGNTLSAVGRIGSNNNHAIEIEVNNARAMRFEPNATSPNVIGGHSANTVSAGKSGATIAGGGSGPSPNNVTESRGTVGGGSANVAAGSAVVAGGQANSATGLISTISGGSFSVASGQNSTVIGGFACEAAGVYAIAGGTGASATGGGSIALGDHPSASGAVSVALGSQTRAVASRSAALGQFNVGFGNPTSDVPTDPVFELGNGSSDTLRSNALTVLKNGDVGIGVTTPTHRVQVEHDSSTTDTHLFLTLP